MELLLLPVGDGCWQTLLFVCLVFQDVVHHKPKFGSFVLSQQNFSKQWPMQVAHQGIDGRVKDRLPLWLKGSVIVC